MKYRKVWPHVVFAILVGVFVFLNNSGLKQDKVAQPSPTSNQVSVVKEQAEVLRVIDGDTIEVSLNNKKETVRLIGIDAPEIKDPEKPVECFGKEAKETANQVLKSEQIILESDPTQQNKDEYNRLLRYVFLNGENFNESMISQGYAYEYTFKGISYRYQNEFQNAETKAKKNRIGLWTSCGRM